MRPLRYSDFDPFDPFGERRHRMDSRWVNPDHENFTKAERPYSYSEFFLFGGRHAMGAADGADYSDRLWQWKYDEADRLWKEHVGCRWDQASTAQLSAFISAYHGRKLTVTALAEGCNPSSGYPYWIVWYRNASPSTPEKPTPPAPKEETR